MNLLAEATIPENVPEFTLGLMLAVVWTILLFVVGLFFCARALRNDWSGLRGIVRPWDTAVSDFVLFAGLLCGLYLVCSVVIASFIHEVSDPVGMAISGGVTQGCFLLTLWMTSRLAHPNFWHSLNTMPMGFSKALRLGIAKYLACFPLLTLSFMMMQAIGVFWGMIGVPYEPEPQKFVTLMTENTDSAMMPLLAVLILVAAPVSEELLFRGVIYRFLKGRMRPLWALLGANVLFGLIHADLFAFLPLCAAGMFFTWAYERTGNIAVPIVCHALLNANTLLLIFLQP